jgi:hypothetical protein
MHLSGVCLSPEYVSSSSPIWSAAKRPTAVQFGPPPPSTHCHTAVKILSGFHKTIALDFRLAKGNMDALPALAAELARIPVNVIVTDSTSATLAAFDATRTIPIVMGTTGGDPVALGLAKSLSRPGANVTGTHFLTGLSEKRLQLLKLAFPGVQRADVSMFTPLEVTWNIVDAAAPAVLAAPRFVARRRHLPLNSLRDLRPRQLARPQRHDVSRGCGRRRSRRSSGRR